MNESETEGEHPAVTELAFPKILRRDIHDVNGHVGVAPFALAGLVGVVVAVDSEGTRGGFPAVCVVDFVAVLEAPAVDSFDFAGGNGNGAVPFGGRLIGQDEADADSYIGCQSWEGNDDND